MAIATLDQFANSLMNSSSRVVVDKASLANAVAGQLFSLWRSTGQPAQGAIPTTAALCTGALTGAISFMSVADPTKSYLAWMAMTSSNSAMTLEVHDRIAHMGGLVLNVVTAQAITGLDLDALSIEEGRRGTADYGDGQWFLDVYSDGGSTASNATISVTYNDGSTGTLNVVAVGGTLRAGRMIALTPFIPTGSQGKYIKAITSVILSASTGTAGNFGFSWRRQRTLMPLPLANYGVAADWPMLGAPEVHPGSCLELVMLTSTTSTGTLRGQAKIAHG